MKFKCTQKGSLVVMVLIAASVLSVFLVVFYFIQMSAAEKTMTNIFDRQAYYLARAGVEHALHKVKKTTWFISDKVRQAVREKGLGKGIFLNLDSEYLKNIQSEFRPLSSLSEKKEGETLEGRYGVKKIEIRIKGSEGDGIQTNFTAFVLKITSRGELRRSRGKFKKNYLRDETAEVLVKIKRGPTGG